MADSTAGEMPGGIHALTASNIRVLHRTGSEQGIDREAGEPLQDSHEQVGT